MSSRCDVTKYTLEGFGIHKKIAVLADLHGKPCERLLPLLREERPDWICIPGDFVEEAWRDEPAAWAYGLSLLRELCAMAPTFYSLGNHEIGACGSELSALRRTGLPSHSLHPRFVQLVEGTGAILLDDRAVCVDGVWIGGLGSGLSCEDGRPNIAFLNEFEAYEGKKILLSHHPEYYSKYIKDRSVDLVLSGHAHGGQWRFFGQGVYAPGQGLFPRYTAGVHDGRLVVSRGLGNLKAIPRIGNRPEVVILTLGHKEKE